jgi:hypothetical protein
LKKNACLNVIFFIQYRHSSFATTVQSRQSLLVCSTGINGKDVEDWFKALYPNVQPASDRFTSAFFAPSTSSQTDELIYIGKVEGAKNFIHWQWSRREAYSKVVDPGFRKDCYAAVGSFLLRAQSAAFRQMISLWPGAPGAAGVGPRRREPTALLGPSRAVGVQARAF